MLTISNNTQIPPEEIDLQPIRAQGSGGQNVNKVSTAIHLRFDIRASSLPEVWKEKLLVFPDQRISSDGVVGDIAFESATVSTVSPAFKGTGKINSQESGASTAAPDVKEVAWGKHSPTTAGSNPPKYLCINGLDVFSHLCFDRKIYSYF